jgi:hypothetical protein
MRIALRSLAVILAFVAVFGSAQSQKKSSLTNQDIVRMVKDKFADSTIVKAIEANHTAFDVSASALIVLKDSGVSQTVIEAMLSAERLKRANAAAQPAATKEGKQAQASAPPSPTQSQAQSAPPCSDIPVLKRGRQPTLPPCPDPPPAASPTADAAPTRSLSPAESLIERAREAAFEFSEKLPNFICEEIMSRFTQRGRGEEMPLDVVAAEIIYRDGQESYRNVKINDRPTNEDLQEIGGSWSTGEFASTLVELFHPDEGAQFRSGGASAIAGFSAEVYDFQVRRENSHWKVQSDSQTLTPAYGGSVWVDPKTARVLRIEMQARDIPSDFPMDRVESAVDYSYVMIAGASFLLPVHAESLGCDRSTSNCSHNIIDFRKYHELEVDFRLLPSP